MGRGRRHDPRMGAGAATIRGWAARGFAPTLRRRPCRFSAPVATSRRALVRPDDPRRRVVVEQIVETAGIGGARVDGQRRDDDELASTARRGA